MSVLQKKILRILQKSGLARFVLIVILFILTAFVALIVHYAKVRTPVIYTIDPPIGYPGDVMVIRGAHFGNQGIDRHVEIAGIEPTKSTYMQWTDSVIMFKIPDFIENGIVYVYAGKKRSNPKVFANKSSIPIAAPQEAPSKSPQITELNSRKLTTGSLLVISGKNFGATRDDSQVLFPWLGAPLPQIQEHDLHLMIAGNENDFGYELWSDREIKVRIPTGAVTGNIIVKTKRMQSNGSYLEIENHGSMAYPESRKYAVTLEAEISKITAEPENVLYIRLPLPLNTSFQIASQTALPVPAPLIENHQNKALHRIDNAQTDMTYHFSHSFVIDTCAVNTILTERNVKPYKETESALYIEMTAETPLLPAKAEYIAMLAAKISPQVRNPYTKAKSIFNYLINNFTIVAKDSGTTLADVTKHKSGSGYDITLLYTALLRASGIPSRPCSGFFVDAQREAKPHWWTEIYFESVGWVPSDIYICMSNDFSLISPPPNKTLFYFGNLDSQHIVFSQGEIVQKPMAVQSKIVSNSAAYALQSIWEESAGNISQYDSFWSGLLVTGIY